MSLWMGTPQMLVLFPWGGAATSNYPSNSICLAKKGVFLNVLRPTVLILLSFQSFVKQKRADYIGTPFFV